MADILKDFSWVRARAECSVATVYERLRLQVREDVEQRKELRTSSERERFNFSMISNGNAFTVRRVEHSSDRSLTFTATEKGIQIADGKDNIVLEGTLTLGDDGQCRLRASVGGNMRDLDFWQFRRAALEDLLF